MQKFYQLKKTQLMYAMFEPKVESAHCELSTNLLGLNSKIIESIFFSRCLITFAQASVLSQSSDFFRSVHYSWLCLNSDVA